MISYSLVRPLIVASSFLCDVFLSIHILFFGLFFGASIKLIILYAYYFNSVTSVNLILSP